MEQFAYLSVKQCQCPAGTVYALGFSYYTETGMQFLPVYLFEREEQAQDALDSLGDAVENLRKYYTTNTPISSAWIKGFEEKKGGK